MKALIIIFLMGGSMAASAQQSSFHKQDTGDTHVVMAGETLYSVSKHFHTTVSALLALNPDIVNNNLPLGKKIKVPVVKGTLWNEDNKSRRDNESVVYHTVKAHETVYSLSKQYHTNVNSILMWNDLKEPSIKAGQQIIVGYRSSTMNLIGPLPLEDVMATVDTPATTPAAPARLPDNEKAQPAGATPATTSKDALVPHDEKGIAVWTHSSYDDGNFYALHPTAPAGTEISVRNLMNNKVITVKVVGKLPAISANENVLIKISESAARKLNVLDDKFLVELNYAAPELPEAPVASN